MKEKCADCGKECHVENMTIRLSPKTKNPTNEMDAVKEFVCELCGDWFHLFGTSKMGTCVFCGRDVRKCDAWYIRDPEGGWGSFSCGC